MSRPVGLVVALLGVAAGCRTAAPLAGGESRPAQGTISGRVAGPQGEDPAANRLVEAVRVEGGDRYTAVTAATGAYSVEVPAGRYRLQVAPAEGEEVLRSPGVVSVDPGELVTGADFVLAGAGVVLPHP